MTQSVAKINYQDKKFVLDGPWNIVGLEAAEPDIALLVPKTSEAISIDTTNITTMDTVGAWFFISLLQALKAKNINYEIAGLHSEYKNIIDLVQKEQPEVQKEIPTIEIGFLENVGRETVSFYHAITSWLNFIGEIVVTMIQQLLHPSRIRWKYFLKVIELNGFRALPIVGFLSLLIGVVITYQTGLQLRQYGANVFIISLLGLATFREFAPLITAIIIAGRTGSAFTAQIGVMKINEEIDALRTMGYSPIDMLVIPKILGLIIALPLLTVWADIFGIIGGMVMSKNILNINYMDFISQFPDNVTFTTFIIGIIKAPVFAMIIASVGCYHGFQVNGSSESIGLQTTKSVVLAIFMIIAADAAFSVVLSWLNI